jgi:serine/threonine-protein kinase
MTERDDIPLEELAPEVEAPRNRRRGPRFNLFTGTLGLSLLALAGGFLVVNLVLMPSLTRQGEEVRVPDLTAKSEREAERALASEDLRLSKISEQWSPDIPRGYISRQEPEPGAVVKRGRRISVVVSLGTQGTTVPVLDGESVRRAEIMLEGAGLRRGNVATVYTDEAPRDMVVATDPPGETVVDQESAVYILVSAGSLPRRYIIPDLTGRELAAVSRELRYEGFLVLFRQGGSRIRGGLVSAQEPLPGSPIAPRDSIILYANP